MLKYFAIYFIPIALGIILGAYLPLLLSYIVSFLRREHLELSLISKAAVRLAGIIISVFVMFVILTAVSYFGALSDFNTRHVMERYFDCGLMGGLFGGMILFFASLTKGKRSTGSNPNIRAAGRNSIKYD